jgi:hypothetical protein
MRKRSAPHGNTGAAPARWPSLTAGRANNINEKGPGVRYAGAERVVARPYSAMGYPSLTQASVPPSML